MAPLKSKNPKLMLKGIRWRWAWARLALLYYSLFHDKEKTPFYKPGIGVLRYINSVTSGKETGQPKQWVMAQPSKCEVPCHSG